MLKKLLKNERGDVIQFILVLAVVAIILAFAFPKFKSAMSKGTTKSVDSMECAFADDMTEQGAVGTSQDAVCQ